MTQKNRILNTQVDGLVEAVLTQEEQEALTPDDVIELLKEGNARFSSGKVTLRNHKEQVRKAASGQFPKAIVLSCVDSRVPVEDVFDRGIGDMFVARVAGNFVNSDILGSMEFACKVSGAKVVLVMGHEHCGAVKGAIDKVEVGNITDMLKKIQPAVAGCSDYGGEQSSANPSYVHLVAEKNVQLNVDRIRKESPILRDMEATGEIKILGAMYNMDSGEVVLMGA
jgi:carbonic anhydrase